MENFLKIIEQDSTVQDHNDKHRLNFVINKVKI